MKFLLHICDYYDHVHCTEKFIEPAQSRSKSYYYHRRYRRVPTIDECEVGDPVCYFEANEQFKRDRSVEYCLVVFKSFISTQPLR